MPLGDMAFGFSVTGKIASSFTSMTKTIDGSLGKLGADFTRLGKTEIDGKKTFGKLAKDIDKGNRSLGKLSRSFGKNGREIGQAERKVRGFNKELVKTRQLSRVDFNLDKVKKQLKDAKGEALGVVAAGYSIKRLYSSASGPLKAQGNIATLGMEEKGIQAITRRGFETSLDFGQIDPAKYIDSSYRIKSAISSLNNESVDAYTHAANLTAIATKSQSETMTKLFGLGHGIFSEQFDGDTDFLNRFSGAVAATVQEFNTDGEDLAQGLQRLGSTATAMGVSMAEQLAILGTTKQVYGSASEGMTGYASYIAGVGKAQKKLGLTFTKANGDLLSIDHVLGILKARFGDTFSLAEQMKITEAFGSQEAFKYIASAIKKVDYLKESIKKQQEAELAGMQLVQKMAKAAARGWALEKLGNSFGYLGYTLGKTLEPAANLLAAGIGGLAQGLAALDSTFPTLVPGVIGVATAFGVAYVGIKTVKFATLGLRAANWALTKSFLAQSTASAASGGVIGGLGKLFRASTYKTLAFSAATKAATAGQWLFNAAMRANPLGLLITGVMGLAAGAT